jgi:hypothetical protein
MAAWFTAALPFIPDVIKLATPLFTRSKPQDHVPEVVVTQITELQNASAQNTEALKTLASEMQKTIDTLQAGANALAKDLRAAKIVSLVAATTALLSFGLAAYALAST